jgi:hypothetical protein
MESLYDVTLHVPGVGMILIQDITAWDVVHAQVIAQEMASEDYDVEEHQIFVVDVDEWTTAL